MSQLNPVTWTHAAQTWAPVPWSLPSHGRTWNLHPKGVPQLRQAARLQLGDPSQAAGHSSGVPGFGPPKPAFL